MNDMIDRDAAIAAVKPWEFDSPEGRKDREAAVRNIRAIPAVTPQVTVKPLVWFEVERGNNGYGKWTAEGYTVRKIEGIFMLDFAGAGKSIWRFITSDDAKAAAQADYEARIRSALTVTPAPDAAEIDLRVVMMEEIEKAAGLSPWVPPEYTMNEVVSDCCAFLRENREPAPDAGKVQALVEAVQSLLRSVCGPTGFADAVRHDSGYAYPWPSLDAAEAQARAALAAMKEG